MTGRPFDRLRANGDEGLRANGGISPELGRAAPQLHVSRDYSRNITSIFGDIGLGSSPDQPGALHSSPVPAKG